jgi:hypothetical protein
VGNESLPSNSDYHNVGLLPVSTLRIVQEDDTFPVISWSHPSSQSIARYDLYLGEENALEQLNQDDVTTQSYTETGFTGEELRDTVEAVDTNMQKSVGRSIVLPSFQCSVNRYQS